MRGKPERAGKLLNESLVWNEAGLYGEAVLDNNEAAGAIRALLDADNGAASTGAWPPLVKVRADGFVQDWALVELSIASRDGVVSQRDTTKVIYVRGLGLPSDVSDEAYLTRSIWIMSDNQPPGLPPVLPPAPVPDLAAALVSINSRLDAMQTSIQNMPTRALPPGNGAPPFQVTVVPDISVSSKYDGVSLLGMTVLDAARRMLSARQAKQYKPDEEFMRAMVDKLRVQHEQEERTGVSLMHTPVRAVDDFTLAAWRSKVPHLRADEAMQSTLAGSGDELVPTAMNSTAWYAFMLESRVLQTLGMFRMPTNPFTWPAITGGPNFRKVSEVTDLSQGNLGSSNRPTSKPTTSALTFNCLGEGIGALAIVSSVLFEDAGLSVADVISQQFARNGARDIDYVLLNGDESANATNISHYGADPTGTAYDKILILDGLRHKAFDNTDTADVSTVDIDDLAVLQAKMGARGIIGTDLGNLVCFVDPGVYYKLKVLTAFRTYDQAGPDMFTLKNGYVGIWDGIPVVVSDELENCDASGHILSTHADAKGNILLVHRLLNKVGFRREMAIEAGTVPHTGMFAMSASVRFDLQAMEAGSVAYGYDATV